MEYFYLLIGAIGVGFVEGCNPPAFALLFMHMQDRRNILPAIRLALGIFTVFVCFGLIVYYGLAAWFHNLLPDPEPWEYLLGVPLGVVLVVIGIRMRHYEEKLQKETFSQGKPFWTGALVAALDFPMSLPYFAILQQMHQARLDFLEALVILLAFNFCHIAPLVTIAILARLLPDSKQWVLDWVRRKILSWGIVLIKFLLVAVGIIVFIDGIMGFQGDPLLPF